MSFFAQVFQHLIENDHLGAMMVERLESSSKEEIVDLYAILQLGNPVWPFDENDFVERANKFYEEKPYAIITTFVRLNDVDNVIHYLSTFNDDAALDAYFLAIELGYIDIARTIYFRRFVTETIPHPIYRECRKRNIVSPYVYMGVFARGDDPTSSKKVEIARTIDCDSELQSKTIAYTIFVSLLERKVGNLERIKECVPDELKNRLRLKSYVDFIKPYTSDECMKCYLDFLG